MSSDDGQPARRGSSRSHALAGALAAACALAAAELLAGVLGAVSSPVELIGDRVIDGAPPVVKDVAIAMFGAADKAALQVGTVVLALAFGAVLGVAAARWWSVAAVGFVTFGLLGVAAAAVNPRASLPVMVLCIGVGVGVGLFALQRLVSWPDRPPADRDRRRMLLEAGAIGAAAVVAGWAGRWLLGAGAVDALPASATALPPAADPLAPPVEGLDVAGVSPLYVPNDSFYRIDTALRVPRVDVGNWQLSLTGLVEREQTWTYDDLRARSTAQADVTIACVSNEVGGRYVGNARWQGVWLRDLLDEAGVSDAAMQLVGRSVDGFTAAFPVEAATDGRAAMVALAMNGEPLPLEHGYPARLIVPGLYGYVSATKWLAEIELVDDAFEGYWISRGWAKRAPIKTQSRIDVPRSNARLGAGTVAVAGVAWAPTRGITAVEVSVDDGAWQEARLGPGVGDDSWRQWVFSWNAVPGDHRLRVRAVDGTGEVQTDAVVPPRPDGATGHHTIDVTVA